MREKAKKYADDVCGENDEYLKIYHAYEDGHSDGRDIQPNAGMFIGVLLGILLGILLTCLLHDHMKNLCKYKAEYTQNHPNE